MKESNPDTRSHFKKYGVALLCIAVAFAARYSLSPILGQKIPFVLFIPAALLTAWYGGMRPALFALISGLALANYFFVGNRQVVPQDPAEGLEDAVYIISTVTGIVLFEFLHRKERRISSITDELRQGEERFRLMVKHADDYAIFTMGPDRCVASWNPGAERMLGFSEKDLLGKSSAVIFTPEDRERGESEKEFQRAIENNQAVNERWHMRKNGTRFWGSGRLVCLRDEAGNIRGYAKIMRDLTQLKQWEDDRERLIEERTKELLERNTELESLSYTIAHDLRAPLRAMKAFSEVLLDEHHAHLDAEGKDYLNRVLVASERMANLVDDLLEFSGLNREKVTLEPVSLEAVVDTVLRGLSDDIIEKHGSVEVRHPLPTVKAHKPILEKICCHLIYNALKFVPIGVPPKVKIWTENGGTVKLFVEDNGIGIAPQYQQRIFKVFERLHKMDTYPGTGVGLAIVQKGAELMGAAINVDSKENEGSRFWLELQKA